MEYIPAKTIVTKTKTSQWFGIDYNMNIYKGCCHGCIYCDSRSDCYQIEEFDRVRAKENALMIIRDDLRRKVRTGVVGTGAMSDPYNPYERELLLTRHGLELVDAFGFGAAIATKSTLLLRDMEILECIMEHSPVLCKVTITTVDDRLSRIVEPGAPLSSERFDMIARLSERGIFAGILLMPVLPFLEDSEENVLAIVRHAHEAGAKFIYAAFGMTLRNNQREWYFDRLLERGAELRAVLRTEEALDRGGQWDFGRRRPAGTDGAAAAADKWRSGRELVELYRKTYGNQYECHSPRARRLWNRFAGECERYGIRYRMKDIIHAYKSPYEITQLNLFDL